MYGHGQSDGQFKDHTLFKWIDGILDGARQGQLAGSEYDADHIPEEIAVWGGYLTLDGNYARVAQFIHVEDAIERYPGPVLIPGDDHGYSHHMEMMTKAVEDFLKKMNAE